MDPREAVPPPPSPMKNFVGGGGCGCGCLGATVLLIGLAVLVGIPLDFYDGDTTGMMITGGASLTAGLLVGLLGVAMYIGSLFIE